MKRKILLCGLGVIGSNVGYNLLAADSDLELSAVDFDTVESRNLLAQTHSQQFIGQNKTDAFMAEVYMRTGKMPKGSFIAGKVTAKDENLFKGFDLVIDTFDNYVSRDLVHKFSKKANNPVVHMGFGFLADKPIGTVLWCDAYQSGKDDSNEIDVCELGQLTPWLKGATAIMTLNVLDFLNSGKRKNLFINPDLSTKVLS